MEVASAPRSVSSAGAITTAGPLVGARPTEDARIVGVVFHHSTR
jgi:hypothetical protein